MSINACVMCEYWKMDILCGRCNHPLSKYALYTSDNMVFRDAGYECPKNQPQIASNSTKKIDRSKDMVFDKYTMLITKLWGCSEIVEDNVVLIDSVKMSDMLEELFTEVGLIK